MKKFYKVFLLAGVTGIVTIMMGNYANANSDSQQSNIIITDSKVKAVDVVGKEIVDVDDGQIPAEEESTVGVQAYIEPNFDSQQLPENLKELPDVANVLSDKITGDFNVASVTDIIAEEQTFYGIYPFYTAPGNYLQVQVDGPNSLELDYDLYLFKFDMVTGDLMDTPIDVSAYNTTSLPAIPEAVGDVNNLDINQAYAIMIYSKKGCSTIETFTAKVSVTNPNVKDSFEANENAFTAAGGDVNVTPQEFIEIKGTNLNSSIDNDWYAVNVPSVEDFNVMDIAVTGDADVEVYRALSGATLEKFDKIDATGHCVGAGRIYLRVHSKDGVDFQNQKKDYTVKVSVKRFKLSKLSFEYLSNGQPFRTQNYSMGGVRYAFYDSSILEWKIKYLSKNGYLCTDVDDVAYMEVIDEAWDHPDMQRVSVEDVRPSNGVCSVKLEIMPGRGQWTDLTLYIDYDVYLTMHSQLAGYQANSLPVYITSQIRR